MSYDHQLIEKKWQNFWEKDKTFSVDLLEEKKPKKYVLVMFPYPSGTGLHIGHVRNYTIGDAVARFYSFFGFNVFFPIGWDSFGLPAEQYAIQTGNHPSLFTQKNIDNFRFQLKKMGFSFDWEKEINTSDPEYYKWTQWIFLQLLGSGLARFQLQPVIWCPSLGTVLSNEEILLVNGKKVSERGHFPVEKRTIFQWVLKITDYAESLSLGLEKIDWPKNIKTLQKNWIGVQEGMFVNFPVVGKDFFFLVFLPRVDFIFSSVALIVSVFSDCWQSVVPPSLQLLVDKFVEDCWQNKEGKEKKKSFYLQLEVFNQFNQKKIPVFLVNFLERKEPRLITVFFLEEEKYKLPSFLWKKFFSLEEKRENQEIDFFFVKENNLLNDSVFCFKDNACCFRFFLLERFLEKKESVNFSFFYIKKREKKSFWGISLHLTDWVFCRQRYWGEPIPVFHLDGQQEPLSEKDLPLKLPFLKNFVPDNIHYSPLAKLESWVNVQVNGVWKKRDINVMPQWAGSSWYHLAYLIREKESYLSLNSEQAFFLIKKWCPVDIYIGGAEHANLHLLYSRFWHKFLQAKGIVSSDEPFKKLLCQGVVLGNDGQKMSKSLGNVVSPDQLINDYGADALRLYVLFLGPVEKTVKFNNLGVKAMKKWLDRVFFFFTKKAVLVESRSFITEEFSFFFQEFCYKIVNYYQTMKFNLIVSSLMVFINKCYKEEKILIDYLLIFCQFLNPLAPHLSSELWVFFKKDVNINKTVFLFQKEGFFPKKDQKKNVKKTIVIQINGKKKTILFSENNVETVVQAEKLLFSNKNLKEFFLEKEIEKMIVIKNKLINIVLKKKT